MQNALYKPTDQEISYLAQLRQLPGYAVQEKIFLSELDLMQVEIMNVDGASPNYRDALAARHAEAKGGAKFYAKASERIAGYLARMNEKNQPPVLADPTESLFD